MPSQFSPSQIDFQALADLPNTYQQGQQIARDNALRNAFSGGLPMSNGAVDFNAMAQMIAPHDPGMAINTMRVAQNDEFNRAYKAATLNNSRRQSDRADMELQLKMRPRASDIKAITEAEDTLSSAKDGLTILSDMKELSKQAGKAGALGTTINTGIAYLNEGGQSEAALKLDNLAKQNALQMLKSVFGSMPTEGERKILLEIQGSSNQPPNVRDAIYDRAEKALQSRIKRMESRTQALKNASGGYTGGGSPQIPDGWVDNGNGTATDQNGDVYDWVP